ncbi:MAG: YjbQ family protein [Nanoarchaeota archaeon]|nr:YjbQ family protein [Nanoarchaeota archaeon]
MNVLTFSTKEKYELIDITKDIEKFVEGVKEGVCIVYTPHATAGIVINENWDDSVRKDFINLLNKLIPEGKWEHDKIDNNGAAHLKSAIIGPSEVIPIKDGKLQLGRWQSIMFCEFDGPRHERKVYVKVIKCT